MPAEPVKPVSQASRSDDFGTYSPWCSSARGTMKPSSDSSFSLARSSGGALGALGGIGGLGEGLEHGGGA